MCTDETALKIIVDAYLPARTPSRLLEGAAVSSDFAPGQPAQSETCAEAAKMPLRWGKIDSAIRIRDPN